MTVIERILIGFAGANEKILSTPECETEVPKYASLGLMVLCTGTLGMVSGGYALFTIFNHVYISALFGILWGVFVGGIDRFFVITARKKENNDSSPQIKMALPRLVFAAFIGLIISKPLELRIFQKEIDLQLAKEKVENIKQVQSNSSDYETIEELKQEKAQLRQEEKRLRQQWSQAEKIAHSEAEGISGTRKIGKGPVYKEKREQADKLSEQLEKKQIEIQQIQSKIDQSQQKLNETLAIINQKEEQASTLLGQLQALHNLAEEKPIVGQINLCLTFLFVIVEIMPLSLKLMSKFGPYDKAIEKQEAETIFQLSQEIESTKNKIKEKMNNEQIIRNQLHKFINQQITSAIAKANHSPELELVIDNTVKNIVERTEVEMMKQVDNLPSMEQEIEEQINKSQQEYMEDTVKEIVKQKATESKIDDIFRQGLDNFTDYFGNSNNHKKNA